MTTTQTILIIIAILLAILVGFIAAQFMQSGTGVSVVNNGGTAEKSNNTASQGTENSETESESIPAPEEGTTIETSSLSDGQRKLLGALGINADEITLTPEMIACAEAKVGTARLEEIQNGATPSFLEGVDLVACYK